MGQLSYSALDMAVILCKKELGIREECQFLLDFWESKRRFLEWKYQSNKKRFLQDTQYWIHYLNDKQQIDCEFADIVKAAENNGTELEVEDYWRDLDEVDILFKEMYLDIAFFRKTKYIRKSMRQLLAKYHLKRRTAKIVEKIESYVRFYEMEMIVNRKRIFDLNAVPLDQLITFRLHDNRIYYNKMDKIKSKIRFKDGTLVSRIQKPPKLVTYIVTLFV